MNFRIEPTKWERITRKIAKTTKMAESINRTQRPNGFKTMSILGYISQGLSLVVFPIFLAGEISEGHILTAGFSIIYILLAPALITAIFIMSEQKSTLALNLIRIYLWASIPLSLLYAIVVGAESGEILANMVSLIVNLGIAIPVALYWQQSSHSEYLKSFNH